MAENEHKWQRDWNAFVHKVGELVDAGYDEAALTQYFQGRPIHWVGTVYGKILDHERPGMQFTLPLVHVPLKCGKTLKAHSFYAPLGAGEVNLWRGIELGTLIRFSTEIGPGMPPFYGVEWTDLGSGYCIFTLHPEGVRPSEDQKRPPE